MTAEAVRVHRRKLVNNVMLGATGVCAAGIVGVLLFILAFLLIKGAASLDLNFFTQLPKPPGELGGGLANAIVGSAKILGLATLFGVPIGFLGGVYLAEYGSRGFSFAVRYTTDLLNGVPSIVIGVFAYTLIVMRAKHFSAFAGGVALGIMMIPISVRSTEEFLRAVPVGLREGALALGTPKWRMLLTVVIPAARDGILTGVMLNLARVAGETAPLLFTSLGNAFWSPGINSPTATLPETIFHYSQSADPDWNRQAWAGGFVLLMLILATNVIARVIVTRGRPKGIR
ncbi:MAG TPA: phosphate ABC transporter permease PstA [Gemmatimonadaceae bacterium]|nr:phosphate ABC transporter permease PstA [Gemmatimonadaceae bacterium]